jgi:hypothetical protein
VEAAGPPPHGDGTGPRPAWSVARPLVAYAAAAAALGGGQILRHSEVLDRVWAEDGAVFGREAFQHHAWEAVGRGYSGYLVVIPRMLAAPIVSIVPPGSWGRWFALSAVGIAAIAALAVFRAAWPLVPSPWARVALAVCLALGPKMRGEWPSIANAAWPLLMASFWMIISARSDRPTVLIRSAVLAGAVLSSAIGLLFAPIVAVVLWLRRGADAAVRRADGIVAAVFGLAALAQLVGLLTAPSGPPGEPWTPSDVARLVAIRVFGTVALGDRVIDDLWFDLGDVLTVGVSVIVLVAVVALGRHQEPSRRLLAGSAVALAVVAAVLSLTFRGTERYAISDSRFVFDADRYFLIPMFLIISALMILAEGHVHRAIVVPVLAAHLAIVVVGTGLTLPPPGSGSRSWGAELRTARQTCAAAPPGADANIPIAPAGVFFLSFPCTRIVDGGGTR